MNEYQIKVSLNRSAKLLAVCREQERERKNERGNERSELIIIMKSETKIEPAVVVDNADVL